MLRRHAFAVCILAVTIVAVAIPAFAEKPNLSPEKLRTLATHVITGKVLAIYTRTVSEGSWRTTHHVAEVRVETSEKGDGIAAGSLVYPRYWTRTWNGPGNSPPSTNGHRGLPKDGDTLRFYLAKDAYDGFGTSSDGGLTVIGANGFEALTPSVPEKK